MILYTLLKMDGTEEELLQTEKEVELSQLYKWLNCTTVKLIPSDYYPDGMQGTVFGNEEGRFNDDNHRNPHMKVLHDPMGQAWDTVGDLLLEQTEKQHDKWQKARGDA